MYYQESGWGEIPVVFVPGWTMTSEVFCRQLTCFEDSTAYRFITLDPRSHGLTATTANGNYYEKHGEDLHEFIIALGLEGLVLCGWSFATLATLSYVSQFGSAKLAGFIMLDGPPRACGESNKDDWVTYTFDDRDGAEEFFTMAKLKGPGKANHEFATWMLEDRSSDAIEWIISMTVKTSNETAALLNASAHFLDFRTELIRIGELMPVWCVVRKNQYEVVTKWCADNLQTARISAFGEHMMFWEQSERFNAELQDFLKTCVK